MSILILLIIGVILLGLFIGAIVVLLGKEKK